MRSLPGAVFAIVAGMTVGPTLVAAPPARSPGVVQLQAWLNQLDDESFARREQATEQLHAAGEQAIDALAAGALSSSPEVAWRAGEALKRIAVSGNDRTLDRVAAALERVGKQGRSGVVQVVREIRARQKQLKHDLAAAQIRRLGGGLSGGAAGFGGEMMVDVGFLPVAMPAIVEVEEVLEVKERIKEEAAAEAAEAGAAAAEAAEAAAEAAKAVAIAAEAATKEARAAHDPPAKKPDEALPKAPPAEFREVVKGLFPAELSLEIGGGHVIESEAPAELADSVDAFRDLVELPLGAEPPVDAEPALAAEPAEVVDFVEGGEVFAFPAEAIFLGGGGGFFIDAGGEEEMPGESLLLDANWRGGDKGLAVLRDLPDVTSISIQGAKLGDAALKHIAALPRLSNISIQGTVFSVAALRKLHGARPKAYLFCQGEAMVGIHANTGDSCILTSVYPTSGAAEAGLREGDKIVAIDDVEIRDFSDLTISVYGHKVGNKLKIEYERDGQRNTVQVELKARSVLER